MKTLQVILFNLFFSFSLIVTGYSQTIIFNEEVHGIWSKENSPYIVLRDITVPSDSALIIEPGVEVQFAKGLGMTVEGSIKAIGTLTEKIKFTSADTSAVKQDSSLGWNSIAITGEDPDSNCFENCIVEYVYCINSNSVSAISIKGRKVSIRNCEIRNNNGQLLYAGIYCGQESDFTIINSKIYNNASNNAYQGGGIMITRAKAIIAGNLIYNNRFGIGATYMNNNSDTLKIHNNTIVNNGSNTINFSGIDIFYGNAILKNNILWKNNNTSGNQLRIQGSEYVKIQNCIIENNGIDIVSSNVELIDNYNSNPFFVDCENDNYQITDSSSSVNSGTNLETSISIILTNDLQGNSRIYADATSIIDIGAYEYQGSNTNRIPEVINPGIKEILTSSSKEMFFKFSDPDILDTHTLLVETNNPNITITGPVTHTNNSGYTLEPTTDWQGEAEIYLSVTDNQGAEDIDTFLIIVSDTIRYDINDNTVLDADTVYIANSFNVKNNANLEITEGTCIKFLGNYSINVYGTIQALGTTTEKILFTVSDTTGFSEEVHIGWKGIDISSTSKGSIFKHCIFEFVNQSVALDVRSGASLDVISCIFRKNISMKNWSQSSVIKSEEASLYVGNSLFYDNYCYYSAIYTRETEVDLINNTICFNDCYMMGGVYINSSSGKVYNNIFWNSISYPYSDREVYLYDVTDLKIDNCIVKGGKQNVTNSISNLPIGTIYGNYPLFSDTLSKDFNLLSNSDGINAGINDLLLSKLDDVDLKGNSRIYAGIESIPDIGAFEYQGDPVNRQAEISFVEDQTIMINNQTNMTVEFLDPDETDTHTITVTTDNAAVQIQNLSGDTTRSTYDIVPDAGFTGDVSILVHVEDNRGLFDTISYNLEVKESTCGIITSDVVWGQDTIDITCDVEVEPNVTLTINPGTVVRFNGPYSISVFGKLLAVGAENDSIRFTLHDSIDFSLSMYNKGWQGIYIYSKSEPQDSSELRYCEISKSQLNGVRVYGTYVVISNCNIHHNVTTTNTNSGAGIAARYYSNLLITENYIHDNYSTQDGGGITINSNATVKILNNTIANNISTSGGGINSKSTAQTTIRNNLIENNTAYSYSSGGIYCTSGDTVENNIIRNNRSQTYGGGIVARGGEIVIINNRIEDNNSFNEEKTGGKGGGVYLSNGQALLKGNLIVNNTAYNGGGICLINSEAIITNNTICKDTSFLHGSGIYMEASQPQIINSIIYGNTDNVGIEDQIYIKDNESYIDINNTLIEKETENIHPFSYLLNVKTYENILGGNPYFTDFENNDFTLSDSSLCINNGTEDTTGLELPVNDILGNERIFDGNVDRIDIGAIEYLGEPINRSPVMGYYADINGFPSTSKEMEIKYSDSDNGDVHTVLIESNEANISIQNISGSTNGSTYDLVPAPSWQGSATIKTIVEHSQGLKDSVYYSVSISDSVCGDITENTTWDLDTIRVRCDITVLEDVSLTITEGTVVEFTGPYKLNIYGTLIAKGTETDSITFTSSDTSSANYSNYWRGMQIYNNGSADSSILKYCKFQYGRSNIIIENDEVLISHSEFEHLSASNGGAIQIYVASPVIEYCTFANNSASYTGGAISYLHDEEEYWSETRSPQIIYNEFYNNHAGFGGAIYIDINCEGNISYNIIHHNTASYGGAIYFYKTSWRESLICNNNLIYKNMATYQGGAIHLYKSYPIFINNTIVSNTADLGGAIYASGYASAKFYNSIIYNNAANESGQQIYLYDDSSDPSFINCNIEGGIDSIKGNGSGIDYYGLYYNNIDYSPWFVDEDLDNYRLTDSSMCINTATINMRYGELLPVEDLDGNIRIYSGGNMNVDIGAYEFQGDPVNRVPVLKDIADQYTFISNNRTLKVEFLDVDKTDTHTITITSDNVNVTVENLNGNVSGSTFDLVPVTDWEGVAEIVVKVADNGGKYAVDTFNFIVSEYFCGSITENTTWDKDTIKIACDVTVEEGAKLTIIPGTIIVFDDYASLNVKGRILAVGEKENSITFTSSDTSAYPDESYIGWRGIRFYGPGSADTSKLIYCTIKYAKGAYLNYSSNENGGGLFFDDWARALVVNCLIYKNSAVEYGGGIYCQGGRLYTSSSDVQFKNNIISNNSAKRGGGMFINDGNINPRKNYFVNNIICNNTASVNGGGLYCDNIICVNNIITNNIANYGGGIYCTDGSLNIFNSILWGNRANNSYNQLRLSGFDRVNFYNSVLEEGIDGIGSSFVFDYENMIETNPYFISPSQSAGFNYNGINANWALQAISPCIDGGTQREFYYDFEYPVYDIIGNNRVSMDTIDIGAYEFINVPPIRTGNIADQLFYIGQGNLSINCNVFSDENIGDSINYNIGDSDIPDWMNIQLLNDNINITGSPNSDDIGTSSVIIIATDLFGEMTSDTFNISVIDSEPPVLQNNLADTSAVVNVLFTYVIPEDAFVDPDVNDELTYSALLDDGNSLPIWLSFNSISREFQGTPLPEDINVLFVVVYATDKSGKMASDTFRITITQDISSLDRIDGGEFSVYPIPAKEHLNIEFPKTNTLNGTSIDLYDVNGRLINSNIYYIENIITLDVQNLKSGIYYLEIEHNNSVKSYKIPICK